MHCRRNGEIKAYDAIRAAPIDLLRTASSSSATHKSRKCRSDLKNLPSFPMIRLKTANNS